MQLAKFWKISILKVSIDENCSSFQMNLPECLWIDFAKK